MKVLAYINKLNADPHSKGCKMKDESHDLPNEKGVEDREGVDRDLVRWMLEKSPAQRLAVLQQYVRSMIKLRNGRISS